MQETRAQPQFEPEVRPALIRLAKWLYLINKVALPAQSHKFSPKKFTCAQIQTLLELEVLCGLSPSDIELIPQGSAVRASFVELLELLSDYGHLDFRRLVKLLEGSAELRNAMELSVAPNYSTLYRAKNRGGFGEEAAQRLQAMYDDLSGSLSRLP